MPSPQHVVLFAQLNAAMPEQQRSPIGVQTGSPYTPWQQPSDRAHATPFTLYDTLPVEQHFCVVALKQGPAVTLEPTRP